MPTMAVILTSLLMLVSTSVGSETGLQVHPSKGCVSVVLSPLYTHVTCHDGMGSVRGLSIVSPIK